MTAALIDGKATAEALDAEIAAAVADSRRDQPDTAVGRCEALRIALAADAQACREVSSIEAAPSPGTAVVVMAMTIAAIVRGRRFT